MNDASRMETVSVDRPCPRRWSELVGDERRRFCSQCQLHVTNLSALDRAEAEAFLAAERGRVCVTYVPRAAGGAASREDLGAGGRPRRRPEVLFASLARIAALFLGLVALLPGCRPAPAPPDDEGRGTDPRVDPGGDIDRRMGRVRADPQCVVDDDDRMILGERVAPGLEAGFDPGLEPGPQASGAD